MKPALVALGLLSCAVPRAAWGGDTPTAAEKDTARGMMDAGRAQRDAGHHEAALSYFQGADAIMHVPTTGLEVAREQMALGHLVEARDAAEAVRRAPAAEGEPEVFRMARKAAGALDDELVKRIPALRVRVTGNPAQVKIDGTPIPLPALIAPFKVNPGHHVIVATAAGHDARVEVDVAEGQTTPVDVASPEAASTPPSDATAPIDAAADGTEERHPPPIVPWLRWGGLGLAAVGVAVGTVTGVIAIGAKNSAQRGCVNGMCPPPTWNDLDTARTTSTVSTVGFCAAGVGAGLAVVSFLLAPEKAAAPPPSAANLRSTLTPWVGPTGAGLLGTF